MDDEDVAQFVYEQFSAPAVTDGGAVYSAPTRLRTNYAPAASPDKRPSGGPPRMTFYTPTDRPVGQREVREIKDVARQFGATLLPMKPYGGGVIVGGDEDVPRSEAVSEIPHAESLDLLENAIQDVAGGSEKSTLFLGGPPEKNTVQPCFILNERLADQTLRTLERNYRFITGVDSTWYFNENRLYVDTGTISLSHGSLDVAELLTRRTISGTSTVIRGHTFKRLPRQPVR